MIAASGCSRLAPTTTIDAAFERWLACAHRKILLRGNWEMGIMPENAAINIGNMYN